MLSVFFNALLTVFLVTVAVAYFTLLERKILAATQRRRGPNMVGVWGLLQPFADAIKLLSKSLNVVSGANYTLFVLCPILLLALSLSLWALVPIGAPTSLTVEFNFSMAVIMLLSGINSYFVILSAISSHSRYSHLGGLRAIAQVISYEIPLSILVLTISAAGGGLNLVSLYFNPAPIGALMVPVVLMLFIVLLAETNRAPFDLPEAEAELVAGYNLEYSSVLFAFFFLAEYNNIIIGSMVMSVIFFSKISCVACLFFIFSFIIIRAISPRYTFAQLLSLCWTSITPLAIFYFIFYHFLAASFGILPVKTYCRGGVVAETMASSDVFNYAGGSSTKTVLLTFLASLLFVSTLYAINRVAVHILQSGSSSLSYECGFAPFSSPICNIEPQFVPIALMFLVYDVDILLMFPWAFSVADKNVCGLVSVLAFIALMLAGLIIEVEDGVFESF